MRSAILGMVLLAACGGESDGEALGSRVRLDPSDFGRTEEVRDYLASGGSVWSEDIPVPILEDLTKKLYFAGARKVLFAGIEDFEGTDISAWYVVELPEEQAKRKEVLAAFNAVYTEYTGDEPVPDKGQRFLDITLD